MHDVYLSVKSRVDVQNYYLPDGMKHAIISISGPTDAKAVIRPNRDLLGVLRVEFDDVEIQFKDWKLIDRQQAAVMIEFARRVVERGAEAIICQCEAGIARSAATAAALSHLFDSSPERFTKYPYSPNWLVYNTLVDEVAKFRPVYDRCAPPTGAQPLSNGSAGCALS